jgi:hypothetical protein
MLSPRLARSLAVLLHAIEPAANHGTIVAEFNDRHRLPIILANGWRKSASTRPATVIPIKSAVSRSAGVLAET